MSPFANLRIAAIVVRNDRSDNTVVYVVNATNFIALAEGLKPLTEYIFLNAPSCASPDFNAWTALDYIRLLSAALKTAIIINQAQEVLNMAQTAENFPRSDWQRLYLAALAETDKTKLTEKLHRAEAAIFERLQKLSTSVAPEGERTALDNAIRGLRALKRNTLYFPDWS